MAPQAVCVVIGRQGPDRASKGQSIERALCWTAPLDLTTTSGTPERSERVSTPRTIHCEYPRGPADVVALLSDPSFLERRCEAAGERNVEVTVQQTEGGIRVVVARDRDVSLPAFAKHMFNPKNRVIDDTHWRKDGDGWVAEYAISIQGIPGEARGKTYLTPHASGCRYESTFEVTSRVAMFKSKVESFLADRIEESLRANAERNRTAL